MPCVMDCRRANISRYGFQRCECLAVWIAEGRISQGMAIRGVNALRYGLQMENGLRYGLCKEGGSYDLSCVRGGLRYRRHRGGYLAAWISEG
jgi:hypothetical protein